MATAKRNETEPDNTDSLSAFETLRLNAVHAYYSISKALRFDKVAALLQRAQLNVDIPVCLLGRSYVPDNGGCSISGSKSVLEDLVLHFHSVFWLTYRNEFVPLFAKDVQLRTDVGWGCTLRSIQMIAAQALQRHVLGREWRWSIVDPLSSTGDPLTTSESQLQYTSDHAANQVLRLFWDVAERTSPFSIHNICRHGEASGVFPGRWIGPWTGCRALEAAAAAAAAAAGGGGSDGAMDNPSLPSNLAFKVCGEFGGGAPLLPRDEFLPFFENVSDDNRRGENNSRNENGLVLLFPLVLGLGKLNPIYVEQLLVTFSMPQSLGIVGGRPDASLYFVGAQGESLLYLDPHQVQKAAKSDADWWTFRCEVLRTLPISAIDPSLALGFYCQGEADFDDLCSRLSELESLHRNCPLICVRKCAEILQNDDIEKALQCWEDDDDVDNDSDDEEEYFTDEKSEGGVLDNSNMTCSENTDTDEEGSNDGIVIDDEIPENGGDIFEESDDEQGDGQNKYNDKYQDIPPTRSLYALEYKPHSNGESNDKTDENQIDKDSENLLRQASSVRSAWELI